MFIDDIDLNILILLMRNSRIPFRQLANKIGIGESTVYTRINRLRKAGVLRYFTIGVDLKKLGLATEAILEIKPYPHYLRQLKTELQKLPYVIDAQLTTGDYPIHLRIAGENNEDLAAKIDEIASIDGIADINIKYVVEDLISKPKESVISELLKSRFTS